MCGTLGFLASSSRHERPKVETILVVLNKKTKKSNGLKEWRKELVV